MRAPQFHFGARNNNAKITSMPSTLESLLSGFEKTNALFGARSDSHSLAVRLDILDQLDLHFPQTGPVADSPLEVRAQALRARMEAANLALYESIRGEIRNGVCPALFARELKAPTTPPAGAHYDHLDELLAGVFAFPEPDSAHTPTDTEQVFYQPTPARHIFAIIREARLTAADTLPADTLIDLGSGLGHVPLLVSACTGARTFGVELEPAYVGSARHSAEALNLKNATFLTQDARAADLSRGTVFYLYTPFTGSILRTVLDNLRAEANRRSHSAASPFRIATFGPCALTVAKEQWLVPATPPAETRITVFHPNAETPSTWT